MSDPHVLGAPLAPVTIVEYADLECPYCRAAAPVLREVVESSQGRVSLEFRHFPLFETHPHALTAALAVEAAAEQGRFWELVDELFAHQDRLTDEDLVEHAHRVGLPRPHEVAGPVAQRHAERVREDYATGLAAGVDGTPTIFVDGVRFRGRPTPERLREAVERAAAARFS
ncbi:DsbA family protein [Xylanimonas ulmi]|uniref:Thioredoxin-like protein n=1 Tax=Xylanimonas ulmi TaxID=228973 RepID=A0A4Q7LYR6_9MICO|nr:thioredoxin domain-containing protein [Xylanibacterium ulmi]RZS59851.1 thioredoxin-like protein [Xylanibacterium ulmi]